MVLYRRKCCCEPAVQGQASSSPGDEAQCVLCRKHKLLKEGDSTLSGDHIREGLCGVISVKASTLLHL